MQVQPEEGRKIDLSSIMEKAFWQKLQDTFSKATGLAALTVDNEKPVTEGSNFTAFCMDLTRKSPEGYRRCNQCDLDGGKRSRETGRPAVYQCHAGLVDMGTPIIVDNQQIGSVLAGQVLPDEPDEDKFRAYAKELGIDPDIYIDALNKVPRVSREKIDAAAELLYMISVKIGEVWNQRSVIESMSKAIGSDIEHIRERVGRLRDGAEAGLKTQQELQGGIDDIRATLGNISGVANGIRAISKQTRFVGLNASIEAARAGEAGRGFSVVAEEVRTLSDHSCKTVDEIETFTASIKNNIDTIVGAATVSQSGFDRQAEFARDLMETCDDIAEHSVEIGRLVQKDSR